MTLSRQDGPIWARQLAAVNELAATRFALKFATSNGDVVTADRLRIQEAECVRRAEAYGVNATNRPYHSSTVGQSKKTKTVETSEDVLTDGERKARERKARKEMTESVVNHADLSARLDVIERKQAVNKRRSADALDRAECQARTEMKLSLKPGAIQRFEATTKKAAKHAELVATAFGDILPSALRALRLSGLDDEQIATIVLAHRAG